jgi:hypothetical protein
VLNGLKNNPARKPALWSKQVYSVTPKKLLHFYTDDDDDDDDNNYNNNNN